LPEREIIFVADSSNAALDLLSRAIRLPNPITMVIRCWEVEVTQREVCVHLGVETQRQACELDGPWSDLAIARITQDLFGLFSLITAFANCLAREDSHTLIARQTA
jgi:hypothetical protein